MQHGGAAVFETEENTLTSLPSHLPLRLLTHKGPPTPTRHNLTRRNLTVIESMKGRKVHSASLFLPFVIKK